MAFTLRQLKEQLEKVEKSRPELMDKSVVLSMDLEKDYQIKSGHLVDGEFFLQARNSSFSNKRTLFTNLE